MWRAIVASLVGIGAVLYAQGTIAALLLTAVISATLLVAMKIAQPKARTPKTARQRAS